MKCEIAGPTPFLALVAGELAKLLELKVSKLSSISGNY